MKFVLGGVLTALVAVGLYGAIIESEGVSDISSALSNVQKFNPENQPVSTRSLKAIFTQNPHCELSSITTFAEVTQEDGSAEYVAEVSLGDEKETIRLFKTHSLPGGYKISGISNNGEVKVIGSVIYLHGKGADIHIERVEHYQEGLVGGGSNKVCTFS